VSWPNPQFAHCRDSRRSRSSALGCFVELSFMYKESVWEDIQPVINAWANR
jgi:hypothetical protein